jgi:hypothetical protein
MEPTPEQIHRIDRDRIARVRKMTMNERFLEGLRLWSLAKETVRAGVRLQHPQASESEVEQMTRQRMAR